MKTNNLTLDPEEIRAIRQRLGLTQVEAGELLGGGPRAFTKYETGAVKPAASVINLLRVLEANPAMIATLQGHKSRPMPATPDISPFEVTGDHIAALTERAFPSFLRRLLHAEAEAHRIPADGIHVASNIAAPDGGEDGRIAWEGGPDRTRFLPSRLNQFQLKAGRIAPAGAGREVLTKAGAVKDMVRSVLGRGGHYILLCAHPYPRKAVEARETKIREALLGAGVTIDDDQVQFRDADQIADWANHHPAVAIRAKEQTQPGTIGPFRSWSHWAGRAEHESSPWVEDERLSALRDRLCERVTRLRGIARVVGLSGVGTSRLVLEALGAGGNEDHSLSDIVLYADMSEVDPTAVNGVVQTWADMGTRAIVVVDRCPPDSHGTLARMVSRSGSRLSLVTIDNEIPSTRLDETFKVDEASSSVIEAIIDRVSPGLPSEDRRRLVRFSQGFPKIAVLIGQGWTDSKPVAHATEDHLVEAFVLGRTPRERDLLLKSATLLATFGLVGMEKPVDDQLDEVAARGRHLAAAHLRTAIRRLIDRGAAQRRGRFAILRPRPIAMRLAERQWREWNRDEWDEVLAGGGSPDLKVRAARQLALLNTTDISREVVTHVCRDGGPFDGPEGVSRPGHAEVLSSLTEIDPESVVDQIARSLAGFESLREVGGDTRRHLVWALEKIAFRADTFEDGARLLLGLAVAENEDIGNNATGMFKALFPVILGNTAGDGDARLSILDEAADTDDPVQRSIAVEALVAGATTAHFSRTVGAETHGARPALQVWYPATKDEACRYVERCVERLAEFAGREDESGTAARAGLGHHLRSLISFGFIDAVERVVSRVRGAVDRWPEALEGLGLYIECNASESDNELIERVRALIIRLLPQDLKARVRLLVTEMPWDFPCGEKLDSETRGRRQVEAVCALAEEIVEQPAILEEVLSRLCRNPQRMAFDFGHSVALSIDSPLDWLERIIQTIKETPEGERNFDLLSGHVAGMVESHPDAVDRLKRRVAQSPELAPALPLICWRLGITSADIELAIGALQSGLLPPRCLIVWAWVRALVDLPARAVAPLFDAMLDHGAEAFMVGMDLMAGYAHGTPDRLESLRTQVRKSSTYVTRSESPQIGAMTTRHFRGFMTWMLKKGRQDPDACATASTLARALANTTERGIEALIEPVVPMLLSDFPEIAWPLIGQAIVSADWRRAWRLRSLLGSGHSSDRERDPTILSLPQETLFAWCHAHPDHAPVFVASVAPILTSYRADAGERSLHPVMLRLLDEFGDREDVRQAIGGNLGPFSCWGSPASYFALYREPFGSLHDHPKKQVRRWAKTMLRRLDVQIREAGDDDEEQEALWGM